MSDDSTKSPWPQNLNGVSVHMVGAKGTGMCALAELLVAAGAVVHGSDVEEVFYTDAILNELGVTLLPFEAQSLGNAALVVRSAAYGSSNPVVAEAETRNLPIFSYPEALGALSRRFDSSGIAGVHGKTTTTAMTGALLQALESPATVIVGSAVSGFGDRSTWSGGDRFLVAETCEYRRHFLHFAPSRILLTSVESDHQDYYPDYASIRDAFIEYVCSLPEGGLLIYCADEAGAAEVAQAAAVRRPDLRLVPYGVEADGPWRLEFSEPEAGMNRFRVAAFDREFHLKVPGQHLVLDAAAALALAWDLEVSPSGEDSSAQVKGRFADRAAQALAEFRGSRRRSEILGEADGILFMDDYAHHPTAVAATLQGLREFHPDRRLIVDFQAHTYSRTASLWDEFTECFGEADALLLQPIYASAREKKHEGITGETFRDAVAEQRPGKKTLYCSDLDRAADAARNILAPGDLFITLGAGNNRPLGQQLLKEYS